MPTRRVKPTIVKEKMRAARTYEIWGGQVLAQKLDLQVFRGSRSGIFHASPRRRFAPASENLHNT
jgi:hypothetical protein